MLSQITKIALPKVASSISLSSLQQLERVSLKSLVSLQKKIELLNSVFLK